MLLKQKMRRQKLAQTCGVALHCITCRTNMLNMQSCSRQNFDLQMSQDSVYMRTADCCAKVDSSR